MSNVDNEAANFDNPLLNPLLRRESLSIVNRRRLEEANMMNDNVEKVMKLKEQCSQQFFAFIWLVLCNYIPSLWGGFRNPECGMPIRKANNYFAAMTSLTSHIDTDAERSTPQPREIDKRTTLSLSA